MKTRSALPLSRLLPLLWLDAAWSPPARPLAPPGDGSTDSERTDVNSAPDRQDSAGAVDTGTGGRGGAGGGTGGAIGGTGGGGGATNSDGPIAGAGGSGDAPIAGAADAPPDTKPATPDAPVVPFIFWGECDHGVPDACGVGRTCRAVCNASGSIETKCEAPGTKKEGGKLQRILRVWARAALCGPRAELRRRRDRRRLPTLLQDQPGLPREVVLQLRLTNRGRMRSPWPTASVPAPAVIPRGPGPKAARHHDTHPRHPRLP